jgi:hypothetical protein
LWLEEGVEENGLSREEDVLLGAVGAVQVEGEVEEGVG